MLRKRSFVCLAAPLVALLTSVSAFGAGFQLYNEGSAEAMALGGAVSARTDVLANAWYNPAALKDLERARIALGMSTLNLGIEYTDNRSSDYSAELENHWRFMPHMHFGMPLNEDFVFSLSMYTPYGMITEWEENWLGRYIAVETRMEAVYMTPALTWKATDKLALSAGINIVRSEARIRKYLPAQMDIEIDMKGDDWGWGYMLAGHYTLNDEWAFGGKFQSRVNLEYHGDVQYDPPYLYEDDMEADVELPASVTLGVANNTFERWTFTADVVWTEWSNYDELTFSFDTLPGRYPGEGGDKTSTKNWKNVYSLHLGAEYRPADDWRLRFGYVYDDSPAPGDWVSPEMPDSDRHIFNCGIGYRKTCWGVDLGYSYIMSKKQDSGKLVGSENFGTPLDGEYDTDCHIVSLTFEYSF